MKELITLGVAALGCLAIRAASPQGPSGSEPEEPVWLTNYEQARKVARATGKPIFVVFRGEAIQSENS